MSASCSFLAGLLPFGTEAALKAANTTSERLWDTTASLHDGQHVVPCSRKLERTDISEEPGPGGGGNFCLRTMLACVSLMMPTTPRRLSSPAGTSSAWGSAALILAQAHSNCRFHPRLGRVLLGGSLPAQQQGVDANVPIREEIEKIFVFSVCLLAIAEAPGSAR